MSSRIFLFYSSKDYSSFNLNTAGVARESVCIDDSNYLVSTSISSLGIVSSLTLAIL